MNCSLTQRGYSICVTLSVLLARMVRPYNVVTGFQQKPAELGMPAMRSGIFILFFFVSLNLAFSLQSRDNNIYSIFMP